MKTVMFFGLAILLCGCSSSYRVSSTGKDADYRYRDMNEETKDWDVEIEMKGAGFGLGIGATVGLLWGTQQEEDSHDLIPPQEGGLILGGGAGLIIGVITGLIGEHSYNDEFQTTDSPGRIP